MRPSVVATNAFNVVMLKLVSHVSTLDPSINSLSVKYLLLNAIYPPYSGFPQLRQYLGDNPLSHGLMVPQTHRIPFT